MTYGCCCELRWTTTKAKVNIDTTNERGIKEYALALVQAKCIPIRNGVESVKFFSLLGNEPGPATVTALRDHEIRSR